MDSHRRAPRPGEEIQGPHSSLADSMGTRENISLQIRLHPDCCDLGQVLTSRGGGGKCHPLDGGAVPGRAKRHAGGALTAVANSSGLLVLSMDQPGLGLVIWSVPRPSPLPALERLEIKALRASLPPFGATSSHIALGSCGPQPPTRGLSA